MKHRKPADAADSEMFSVIMTNALRERFERWLRHERLQMTKAPFSGDEMVIYVVMPLGDGHAPNDR